MLLRPGVWRVWGSRVQSVLWGGQRIHLGLVSRPQLVALASRAEGFWLVLQGRG